MSRYIVENLFKTYNLDMYYTLCFQGLMTEGTEFESYPTSLTLPAESGPFPVKIMGLPKKPGQLTVIGERC